MTHFLTRRVARESGSPTFLLQVFSGFLLGVAVWALVYPSYSSLNAPAHAQDIALESRNDDDLFKSLLEATKELGLEETLDEEGAVLSVDQIVARGVDLALYDRFQDIVVPVFNRGLLSHFGKVVFGIEMKSSEALREFKSIRPRLVSEFRDEMIDYLTTLPNDARPNVASIQRRIAYRIKKNLDAELVERIIVEGVFRAAVVYKVGN